MKKVTLDEIYEREIACRLHLAKAYNTLADIVNTDKLDLDIEMKYKILNLMDDIEDLGLFKFEEEK